MRRKNKKNRPLYPTCEELRKMILEDGVIRIGNDHSEIKGRPCASPLELTDDMKNKIRAKKSEKNN